jgi:hypothetical protein
MEQNLNKIYDDDGVLICEENKNFRRYFYTEEGIDGLVQCEGDLVCGHEYGEWIYYSIYGKVVAIRHYEFGNGYVGDTEFTKLVHEEVYYKDQYYGEQPTMSYEEQLKTIMWFKKRREIFKRDKHKCVVCDSEENLHCHHKRYIKNRLAWEYSGKHLITLCEECHKKIHSK